MSTAICPESDWPKPLVAVVEQQREMGGRGQPEMVAPEMTFHEPLLSEREPCTERYGPKLTDTWTQLLPWHKGSKPRLLHRLAVRER